MGLQKQVKCGLTARLYARLEKVDQLGYFFFVLQRIFGNACPGMRNNMVFNKIKLSTLLFFLVVEHAWKNWEKRRAHIADIIHMSKVRV